MAHNLGQLSPRVRGTVLIAGLAFRFSLLAFEKLIHGRQSPYNRLRLWRKRLSKEKREGEPRTPRRYNARENPANWTIVQVPINPEDSKPKRRRRKKKPQSEIAEPEIIHVAEEPSIDESELARETARKRRAAWERWF